MTARTMQTGTCACGATVERPVLEGKFAGFLAEIPFVCDFCIDRDERAELAETERSAAQRAADRHARRVERAAVPPALAHVTFGSLTHNLNENAHHAAKRWANGHINGLLLTGNVGVGKTTLAAAAINEALKHRAVTWVAAAELMAKLSTGFDSKERELATEALLGTAGLVLDDIDKIRPTSYGAEQLYVAIDNCLQNQRPLLVTMNSSLGEMADRYPDSHGEAIASRLASLDEGHRVTGRDRRLTV